MFVMACKDTSKVTKETNTSSGGKYAFETVPGDPMGVKIYTLKNGLKVYMNVLKDEPRVQTMIATRAGSKNDPHDATGLAHYLEHMLFKGSSKIGAMDWAKEKPLLDKISALYEKHRNTTDPEERKKIYAEIDATSQEAAKYVSTNEYDRMITSLGAKGTNAFTSLERTVYVNDIPSNELEKWMKVESERFKELVLRLFHTELEAVYEEFNISQNNDGRKAFYGLLEGLFPSHTYGTQTTIGTGEHLKNPSMVKIHEYFNRYYVPNNMAIVISGDFDPNTVVALTEKYFGSYQPKEVPKWTFTPQPEFAKPVVKEVFGLEAENVALGWRVPGANTDDALLANLVKGILFNGQAGLIDIELKQKQATGQDTDSWFMTMDDYSLFVMGGNPKEGQKLEEVKDLLLAQLARVRKGDFGDWLIPAVIKDYKLSEMKQMESNRGRTGVMLDYFIFDISWKEKVNYWARMEKFTKQDVMNFANKYLKDNNYCVVYKREGDDPTTVKVEKPSITPVPVNRTAESDFKKEFNQMGTPAMSPEFINFDSDIQSSKLSSGVTLDYIKNTSNPTFSLYYIVDMGKNHDQRIPLAVDLLPMLGTDKLSAEEVQREFFKLGLYMGVSTSDDRCYITLSGLDESFEQGVALFEQILANIMPDNKAWDGKVSEILKSREDAKKDKATILRRGMASYAQYGAKSNFTDILTEEQLKALGSKELTDIIKGLTSYEHKVFYFGSIEKDKVAATLNKLHKVSAKLKPLLPEKKYAEVDINKTEVLFVDFPMVQAEVLMVSKGTKGFNLNEHIMTQLYNDYFGAGLSSIVFQEIRESKALAYSASCTTSSPIYADRSHYLRAYIGTQSDKLKDAVIGMKEIIENMPVAPDQLKNARDGILKKYETERITKANIYWLADGSKKRGFNNDIRQEVYNFYKGNTDMEAVKASIQKFQSEKVKNRQYTILVLGDKKRLDMDFLKTLGPVRELGLQEVFGY